MVVSVSVEVSVRTPMNVLFAEFIVLFVNVSVVSLPTTVSVLSGNVKLCKSVPSPNLLYNSLKLSLIKSPPARSVDPFPSFWSRTYIDCLFCHFLLFSIFIYYSASNVTPVSSKVVNVSSKLSSLVCHISDISVKFVFACVLKSTNCVNSPSIFVSKVPDNLKFSKSANVILVLIYSASKKLFSVLKLLDTGLPYAVVLFRIVSFFFN